LDPTLTRKTPLLWLANQDPWFVHVCCVQVQRPDVWPQVQVDLGVLLLLLRLLRWAGRIKQDITLWADTLGRGLAQELDYQQVSCLTR
jgi:hypothetical protein